MNNYYFTMATQHSQMTDRKRTRTDILTTSLDSTLFMATLFVDKRHRQ